MAVYKPRTTAPSKTDKNYIKTTHGGYNYCIKIGSDGSCLPNCVGYAWGRWRELLGDYHKLSRGNAENWWANKDGYERGQTPRLGAICCWRKGQAGNAADGAGHVAIVEQINPDGSIIISQSNYGGTRWEMKTKKAPYSLGANYTFQGFIYLPIKFEEQVKPQTTTSTTGVANQGITLVAQDVIAGKYGNGRDKRMKNIYNAVQAEVNRLLKK